MDAVIAAGGTGGHIFPGLALADALRRARPDLQITFVGTRRGLEKTLIPDAGYPLEMVDMVPFAGRSRYLLPAAVVRASLQAKRLLQAKGGAVAVGMGGYASIPLIVGARLAGIPSVIHESGAVAGRANVVASYLTPNVALAFDDAASRFRRRRPRTVGMPLNPQIASFDRDAVRDEARAAFGVPAGVTMLLVSGGSQGSVRVNTAAVELAARWRDRDDVRIVLKAGRDHTETVRRELDANGGGAITNLVSFFDRMDHAYAAADLMLSRAGAGTVAELALVGLPSILVPYPYAPDDHQAVNAGVLVRAGAALLVRDAEATADAMGPMIEDLIEHPDKLAAMGAAARGAARPHAAEDLAAWVLELADG